MRAYFLAAAAIVVAVAVFWYLSSPPPEAIAGKGDNLAPARPTTVLITFLGLLAFADGPSADTTRALLVDARGAESEVTAPDDGSTCQVKIPRHQAFVAFAPPENQGIVPDYVPWVLNNDEVAIVATRPEGAEDRKPVPGTVPMSDLSLQLDDRFLENVMPPQLVARVTFSGGRFVDGPHSGTATFKQLDGGGAPVEVRDPRLGLTYRIDAEKVTMRRGSLQPITLEGGVWRVVISNQPITSTQGCGSVDPKTVDVHFDWLYELAKPLPEKSVRRYPHFASLRFPGDPCMAGDY